MKEGFPGADEKERENIWSVCRDKKKMYVTEMLGEPQNAPNYEHATELGIATQISFCGCNEMILKSQDYNP